MSTNVDETPNDHGASPSAPTTDPDGVPQSHYLEPSPLQENPHLRPMDPDLHLKDVPDTEFNRKYPPDPWGEEASPNARVWKLYRDEYSSSDQTMLESWNKTLDVLLIFAGLFSAVSTAFLIESYKNLQPDYTQYVATVLYATMVSENRSSDPLPALRNVGPPDEFIHTTLTQRWTNGLWFSSLVVSLSVALLSILIKQWLNEYQLRTSMSVPSLRDWARRHCFYSDGLQTWRVPALISFLPMLLHLSLFLFFAGLVMFLVPLDKAIAYSLLAFIVALGLFYQCSMFLPLVYVECPSLTPLLAPTRRAGQLLLTSLIAGFGRLQDSVLGSTAFGHSCFPRRLTFAMKRRHDRIQTFFSREAKVLDSQKHHLDGSALAILLTSTADKDIIGVGLEAVGAIFSPATLHALDARCDVLTPSFKYIQSRFISYNTNIVDNHITATYARALRASLAISPETRYWGFPFYSPHIPDLSQLLGFDGLLLSLLRPSGPPSGFDLTYTLASLHNFIPAPCDDLSTHSLVVGVESRDRQPVHRSDWEGLLPLVGLVFCVGDFLHAEAYDLDVASSSLVDILAASNQDLRGGPDAGPVVRGFNCLCHMLARREVYAIDLRTSEIIASEAVRFAKVIVALGPFLSWDILPGMCHFVGSANFSRLVRTGPYIDAFLLLSVFACDKPKLPETGFDSALWSCLAMLLKTSTVTQVSDQSFWPVFLKSVERFIPTRSSSSRPPQVHETAALVALLDGETAIGTWGGINNPGKETLESYAALAHRLTCLVRRRPLLQLAGREPIPVAERFFEGTFIVSCFRNQMCLAHRRGWSATRTWVDPWLSLARHCVQISAQEWLRLCDQLEMTGEDGTDLHVFCVARVQELRDIFTRNGEPYAECDADCDCQAEPPTVDQPGVGRWKGALSWARFGREEV